MEAEDLQAPDSPPKPLVEICLKSIWRKARGQRLTDISGRITRGMSLQCAMSPHTVVLPRRSYQGPSLTAADSAHPS
eukprot:38749-Eustigmatos_ZCMA.PRE.1